MRIGGTEYCPGQDGDANNDEISNGGDGDEVLRILRSDDEGAHLKKAGGQRDLLWLKCGDDAPGAAHGQDK